MESQTARAAADGRGAVVPHRLLARRTWSVDGHEAADAVDRHGAFTGRPDHARNPVVAGADSRIPPALGARGRLAKVRFAGCCGAAAADLARRLDQLQLRGRSVSGPTHLSIVLVAAHGLARRLR